MSTTIATAYLSFTIAHAWIATHLLEKATYRLQPGTSLAATLEKQLGRADRRLAASLKALAVLRGLKRRVVMKQVNVANGPMLIDNRDLAVGS